MPQNDNLNSLSEKADAAFQQAAKKVIQRAKQTHTPVVIWHEGKVQEIPSDQIESVLQQRPTRKKEQSKKDDD